MPVFRREVQLVRHQIYFRASDTDSDLRPCDRDSCCVLACRLGHANGVPKAEGGVPCKLGCVQPDYARICSLQACPRKQQMRTQHPLHAEDHVEALLSAGRITSTASSPARRTWSKNSCCRACSSGCCEARARSARTAWKSLSSSYNRRHSSKSLCPCDVSSLSVIPIARPPWPAAGVVSLL